MNFVFRDVLHNERPSVYLMRARGKELNDFVIKLDPVNDTVLSSNFIGAESLPATV